MLLLLALACAAETAPTAAAPAPALVRVAGDRLDEKRLRLVGLGVFGLWLVLSVLGAFVDRR